MINFAVYGPGNISHRFMEGMTYVTDGQVTAFCTRNPGKVRDYAKSYGVEKLLSADQLLEDETIDAVYLSTPQYLHHDQIRSCLLAGKHVLSEKPIAVNPDELSELYAIAQEKGVTLMEAQKALFIPVYRQIKSWLEEGRIGKVLKVSADFSRASDSVDFNHWLMREAGAGAIYDVGCYCLSEVLGLFGPEYNSINVNTVRENGIPVTSRILIEKENGLMITVTCSFRQNGDRDLSITGEKGTITCHEFWKAHDCTLQTEDQEEIFHSDFRSEFTFEIEHFIKCIKEKMSFSPINDPKLSLAVTKILYDNR